MNHKLFYLGNHDGGFDIFSAEGKKLNSVATEAEAQAVVDDGYAVVVNGQLVAAFASVVEAAELSFVLTQLDRAVGHRQGSTLH